MVDKQQRESVSGLVSGSETVSAAAVGPGKSLPNVIRLKYAFRGEIRMFTIKGDMSYSLLVEQLRSNTAQMVDGHLPLGRLQVKYMEGDLVSVVDERDWQECLHYYTEELLPKGQKLKLFLEYEDVGTGGFDDPTSAKTWSPCSLGLNTPAGTALISNHNKHSARARHITEDGRPPSQQGANGAPGDYPLPVSIRPRGSGSSRVSSSHATSSSDDATTTAPSGGGCQAGSTTTATGVDGSAVAASPASQPVTASPATTARTTPLSTPQADPVPPLTDQIKSWTKGNLIGRGANSEVFFGMCKHTAWFFAVKQTLVDKRDPQHAVKVRALQKEIELMSAYRHENVVRYLGSESKGAVFNIFLEYVPGGSIASLLQRFGCFHEKVVRLYTSQILKGLRFLHESNVLHRDIKGGNILVSDKGQVKLADFGCSKKITVDSTGTKTLRGTALWMAPEVIQSSTYGEASDIWSVGCTVIEMVTGRPPWTADVKFDSELQVMYYIANNGGHPKIPGRLTEPAQAFLQHCFKQKPAERWVASRLLEHDFIALESPEVDPLGRSGKVDLQGSMQGGYCSAQPSQRSNSFRNSLSGTTSTHVRALYQQQGNSTSNMSLGGLSGDDFCGTFKTITEDGIEPPKTLSPQTRSVVVAEMTNSSTVSTLFSSPPSPVKKEKRGEGGASSSVSRPPPDAGAPSSLPKEGSDSDVDLGIASGSEGLFSNTSVRTLPQRRGLKERSDSASSAGLLAACEAGLRKLEQQADEGEGEQEEKGRGGSARSRHSDGNNARQFSSSSTREEEEEASEGEGGDHHADHDANVSTNADTYSTNFATRPGSDVCGQEDAPSPPPMKPDTEYTGRPQAASAAAAAAAVAVPSLVRVARASDKLDDSTVSHHTASSAAINMSNIDAEVATNGVFSDYTSPRTSEAYGTPLAPLPSHGEVSSMDLSQSLLPMHRCSSFEQRIAQSSPAVPFARPPAWGQPPDTPEAGSSSGQQQHLPPPPPTPPTRPTARTEAVSGDVSASKTEKSTATPSGGEAATERGLTPQRTVRPAKAKGSPAARPSVTAPGLGGHKLRESRGSVPLIPSGGSGGGGGGGGGGTGKESGGRRQHQQASSGRQPRGRASLNKENLEYMGDLLVDPQLL